MAATSTTPQLELPLRLERSRIPVHVQIAEQLRRAIRQGLLTPGTRLPSTRSVATTLGISRNRVVQAYEELFSEGYLVGRTGSGTYVEQSLPDVSRLRQPVSVSTAGMPRWLHTGERPAGAEAFGGLPEPGTIVFRLGTPAMEPFPQEVWQRVWKRVGQERLPGTYGTLSGDPELCRELAAYLGRARGIACAPQDIIITSGTSQALRLLALAALKPGDRIGFEEPGYPTARQVLRAHGAKLVPVPVDDDGLQVHALPGDAEAPLMVYVTPSHQYPLGSRLSIARRLALLEWAETSDSLIIEDDYDSEFRYDALPLSALAGLDRSGRVAYLGTFSKVLTPTLRLGYLVAPPPLREEIERLKQRNCLSNYAASWPVQRALALLLAQGHLERHIRRMRRLYAEKRAILSNILAPLSHLARLRGLEAGLHAYLALHSDLDPQRILARARERKVIVTALDAYYLGAPDRNGLLLGYGGLPLEELSRGVQILAEVIAEQAHQGD
jgi:GntR family transcriptional regulator/MocR family aminotransferase